jgi:hypothetical protein
MKAEEKIETEDSIVTYDASPEMMQAVFRKLIQDFYQKNEAYSGESIMQNDGPQIDASIVLADIADDIIKFKLEWK